jgi:hypothetical protein
MSESDNPSPSSPNEHYWTVLPKYVAALDHAVKVSHRASGRPAVSSRQYWASVLFTRVCAAATGILHVCPGSPANLATAFWDFTSLAPLVRSLVRACLLLFYLGTELVAEDEAQARLIVMQLRDCTERLNYFRNVGSDSEDLRGFEALADDLRAKLSSNQYYSRLPTRLRKILRKGNTQSILNDDQVLDRMGLLDPAGRAFLGFISSHADISPLAYYRTGEKNRGRGEEGDVDKGYMAVSLDLSCDFILRATADMKALFLDASTATPEEPPAAGRDKRLQTAAQYVLQGQGALIEKLSEGDESGAPLLCSDCFHDEGLRLSSMRIGQTDMSSCPNCGSRLGIKLNRRRLASLAQEFFVWGTIRRARYGASPTVQINEHRTTSINVSRWLDRDLLLIEGALQVGFFYYAPRLWMIGEVEPLKAMQKVDSREEVISRIFREYPTRILGSDETFYRLRKAPLNPDDFGEYDAPPGERPAQGRFETSELPILYGSQDLEVCLHECRVTVDDELYLATLAPVIELKLLDLADVLSEENVSEFESLDMAVHMLFLAGGHSYEISRAIARAARKCGFDGLVYPSYFTLLRTGGIPLENVYGMSLRRIPERRELTRKSIISNLALFGRPIADGLVTVKCINRVILNKVEYKPHFGPLLARDPDSTYYDPTDLDAVTKRHLDRFLAKWNQD